MSSPNNTPTDERPIGILVQEEVQRQLQVRRRRFIIQ
jgi:hypothetical protein